MAATRSKSARRQQVEAAVNYPIDWLEERSGLVGGLKYFLFRNVPRDSNWFHTLGSATLTAFLVQAGTGVILAFYYKPSPDEAYESIRFITDDLTLGWLVRGMHRWGASVFIILMFLHMGRVFLFGAYKYPRELNWDRRRAPAHHRHARRLQRVPAALGPDVLLGHGRRDQHQRDGAVRRSVLIPVPTRGSRDRLGHDQASSTPSTCCSCPARSSR